MNTRRLSIAVLAAIALSTPLHTHAQSSALISSDYSATRPNYGIYVLSPVNFKIHHSDVRTTPDNVLWIDGGAGTASGNSIHDNKFINGSTKGIHITASVFAGTNLIERNDLTGNATAIDNANVATVIARDNIGYNPVGVASITPGGSPYTYTNNDGVSEAIYISGGTVSAIVKNSVTVAAASPLTVWLDPGEAVTVTYTGVPTMSKDRK